MAINLLNGSRLHADIYRLHPTDDASNLDFPGRADAFREEIPSLPNAAQSDQSGIRLDNPLLPNEPNLELVAQTPERPSWADPNGQIGIPTEDTSVGTRIRIRPRGEQAQSYRMIPRDQERVHVVNTPTLITIYDPQATVELSADRIVVWTGENVSALENVEQSRRPIEIYLEGNIEFRQGDIRGMAERMYYNVAEQTGVILESELSGQMLRSQSGTANEYGIPIRLKADVIQQLSPTRFQANNAAFTTSRLGKPQYWIESDNLRLDTGSTAVFDTVTGERLGNGAVPELSQFDTLRVTSENSQLFVGSTPIFRWPTFSTDLAHNPSLYLDRIRVGSDGVFGQQLLTTWNNLQLLGITPDQDTSWTTNLDYLSDRGLGFGTDVEYRRNTFFDQPADSRGFLRSWFINDDGLDNLGQDRRAVPLEESFRGRILGRHRHRTPLGMQISAELGWLSDHNFYEQYYEQEWDRDKDLDTRIELKQYMGNGVWALSGNLQLNDFFTTTEWLPKLDHYQIGTSLFDNHLTWHEHSSVGYARLRTADAPTNPVDFAKFDPLAWERNREGLRAITRHEIDVPLQAGPIKLVPYVLGEAAFWQNDLQGNDVTRVLGQAGVRSSILFWRTDSAVKNELFNLNGLAHKIVLQSEFLWAEANQSSLSLPLYDNLDDDSVEFFRRRFLFDTFMLGKGSNVPLTFDERTFALRSGMQRNVSAPSFEIADDLMMFKLGLRQRIQTKRGIPGQQRIVDWFTFDIETTIFPESDRDNFGEEIGPTIYDARWHVGDRTTILSDGYFDFFDEGLRTISLGAALSRPGRSQYYLGIRSIEGPLSSNVLTSNIAYRLSAKWKVEYGSSIDFSDTGNIGQSGRIVRIGESVLVGIGAYYDASRDNFGIRFDIAPRFIRSKLGMIGGRPLPPAGVFGLE